MRGIGRPQDSARRIFDSVHRRAIARHASKDSVHAGSARARAREGYNDTYSREFENSKLGVGRLVCVDGQRCQRSGTGEH